MRLTKIQNYVYELGMVEMMVYLALIFSINLKFHKLLVSHSIGPPDFKSHP